MYAHTPYIFERIIPAEPPLGINESIDPVLAGLGGFRYPEIDLSFACTNALYAD